MDETFFSSLNYSSVNEDWRTEARALRPAPGDATLCITGSGQRPLDLLAIAPLKVTAIDLNPAQNHLLHLKMAALHRLSFDDYAGFLGVRSEPPRWRCARLDDLRRELPPATWDYWSRRRNAIGAGVLYQGRWETFYRSGSWVLGRLLPRVADTLLGFTDIREQRVYVEGLWRSRAWSLLFHILCSRLACRLLLGDPAYYRSRTGIAAYLYGRMEAMLHRHLARDSFMMSLALRGRLSAFDLPPHLTPDGAALIRERLSCITIVTGDVRDVLEASAPRTFARFSLSDVPSFLDEAGFRRLLKGIVSRAAPGARFCIREFLTRHPWPPGAGESLRREPSLEKSLADEDRSFAYDFLTGVVVV